jgi:uncharacterized protein YwqG
VKIGYYQTSRNLDELNLHFMGVVRNLFGDNEYNKKPSEDDHRLLEKIEVMPGLQLSKALAAHWMDIERTRLPFIKIEATPAASLSPLQSSFGYYPALPKGFPYPTDAEGKFLYPLAQIRCSDLPPLAGFPPNGYLQFYISGGDVYGLDFNDGQSQKNFRVLFFEEDEVREHETNFDFLALGDPDSYNVPLYTPHTLSFQLQDDYVGVADIRFGRHEAFFMAIKEEHPAIADELEEEMWKTFQGSGHKIGGYAYFTQWDPRDDEGPVKDYILLFQMDTDAEIMWGDAGVGNFFIAPEDLAKKDFSRVLYNWDCG